jgi:paraquat-inducible protein B
VSGAGLPPEEADPPAAPVFAARIRDGFPLVWLIPLVALGIAGWLGWRTWSQQGPVITLTFVSASGITAGQTVVQHKSVTLGTVRSVNLSQDMTHVVIRVRMRRAATPVLTDRARFWVVRPRLSASSISGLETLVSGAYIEMDPGLPGGGEPRRIFAGLEQPPAVRSDEPGRTYTLQSDTLGALGVGSPVLYRGTTVGEVLSHDVGKPGEPIGVHIFVRAPYDQYVFTNTYFWNDSGLSVSAGAEGFHVQVESIQALLSGAVSFYTPPGSNGFAMAAEGYRFRLFSDQKAAQTSDFHERLHFLIHFQGSVRGLSVGAPVEVYGIPVGEVTDVRLQFDPLTKTVDVPVRVELEPGRVFVKGDRPSPEESMANFADLVKRGLRAQLRSSNYLTGQLLVAFDFFPTAKPTMMKREGEDMVLPSQPSDLETLSRVADRLLQRLDAIPIDQIGQNLNATLQGLNSIANGPELKSTLQDTAATLRRAQALMQSLDNAATPALQRLPALSASLQQSVERANRLMASVQGGYGDHSQFSREMARLMAQLNETARSLRILADFLDQHPEALIRGRAGSSGEH